MPEIGIVAAMEREVAPLVRNWKVRTLCQSGRQSRKYRLFENVFENGEVALICGGVGFEAARRATEVLIQEAKPTRVISVGFAGALSASLRVGDVVVPRTVINSADGSRTEVGSGDGALVSAAAVAGNHQKARLANAYGAIAVDMEAAAVAQGALARGVEFAAIKAISDTADFEMPALDQFVTSDGRFQTAKFASYMALHPGLWRSTIVMARNSSRASRALSDAITAYLNDANRSRNNIAAGDADGRPMPQIAEALKFAGAHTTAGLRAHTEPQEKL